MYHLVIRWGLLFALCSVGVQAGDVLSSSAGADKAEQWMPFAEWTATMNGLDIIRMPVMGQVADFKKTQPNYLSGKDSHWAFKVLYTLPAKYSYVYRIRSIDERLKPEVLSWPNADNDFFLELRSENGLDKKYGCVLEAAVVGQDINRLLKKSARKADLKMVPVSVTTMPPGAEIWVDGTLQTDVNKGGKLTTPCVVNMSSGRHKIKLRRQFFVPKQVDYYVPKPNQPIRWKFAPRADLVWTEVKLKSRGLVGWYDTGIKMGSNDAVIIGVKGRWIIAPEKTSCRAGGYLDAGAFAKTIDDSYPFGALLLKRGRGGVVRAIDGRMVWVPMDLQSETADNALLMTINQEFNDELRIQNKGDLILQIAHIIDGATEE